MLDIEWQRNFNEIFSQIFRDFFTLNTLYVAYNYGHKLLDDIAKHRQII